MGKGGVKTEIWPSTIPLAESHHSPFENLSSIQLRGAVMLDLSWPVSLYRNGYHFYSSTTESGLYIRM
jgi:hypothetical protein